MLSPISRNLLTLLRCTVITGSFLLNFPNETSMIYGNLVAYTNSYFIFVLGPDSIDIAPEWPMAMMIIMYVIGVLTVDWCLKILNIHITCIIATIFFNLGIFITYITVQQSLGLLTLSLMVCGAFTGGIVRALCFKCAHKAMPRRVGLVSAIVASASSLGSVINNYIITTYINPDNLAPNVRRNNMAYFSQPALLSRVPGVFIYMGIFSFACSLLGFLMEQLPFCFTDFVETSKTSISDGQTDLNDQSALTTTNSRNYKTNQLPDKAVERDLKSPSQSGNIARDEINPVHSEDQVQEVKPLQVIQTRSFYLLCFFNAVLSQGQYMTLNYFKLYGQLWIKDDFFMMFVINFGAVVTTLNTLITGIIIDKAGIKTTLIITFSLSAFGTNLWFFAPRLNKWLYFFSCQLLIGEHATINLIFPVASLKLYGPKYFATNYGLILMASVVTNLISPLLYSWLLKVYSWFGIILLLSVEQTMAVFSVVCIMPADA